MARPPMAAFPKAAARWPGASGHCNPTPPAPASWAREIPSVGLTWWVLRGFIFQTAIYFKQPCRNVIEIVIASNAKQSILPNEERMDCCAEPVIGRAFARPVGSQRRQDTPSHSRDAKRP